MRILAIASVVLLLATLAPLPSASATCVASSYGGKGVRVIVTTGDVPCTRVTVQKCQPRVDPFTGDVTYVCTTVASTPTVPDAGVDCTSRTAGGVPVKATVRAGTDPDCVSATVYRCTYFYDFGSGELLTRCDPAISLP